MTLSNTSQTGTWTSGQNLQEPQATSLRQAFLDVAKESQWEKWLHTKVPAFGFKTPAEMIAEGKVDDVIAGLRRVAYGGVI